MIQRLDSVSKFESLLGSICANNEVLQLRYAKNKLYEIFPELTFGYTSCLEKGVKRK